MPANSKKPRLAKDGVPLRVPLTAAQRAALANHPEPSAGSLRKVPPLDLDTAVTFGRGPEGLRRAVEYMRAKRGRPRKGDPSPGSVTKSLRLTAAEWAALGQIADRKRTTVHALLREAVIRKLAEESAQAVPKPSKKRRTG